MNTEMMSVPFQGEEVLIVEHEGQPYVPARHICDNLGIDWRVQHRKLTTAVARWGVVMMTIPSLGGGQQTLCLPLHKVPAWLMSISADRVKPAVAGKLLAYQNECDTALWHYWTKGRMDASSLVKGGQAVVQGDKPVVSYTLKTVLEMQHRFNAAQEERISLLHWKADALEAGYKPAEVRK